MFVIPDPGALEPLRREVLAVPVERHPRRDAANDNQYQDGDDQQRLDHDDDNTDGGGHHAVQGELGQERDRKARRGNLDESQDPHGHGRVPLALVGVDGRHRDHGHDVDDEEPKDLRCGALGGAADEEGAHELVRQPEDEVPPSRRAIASGEPSVPLDVGLVLVHFRLRGLVAARVDKVPMHKGQRSGGFQVKILSLQLAEPNEGNPWDVPHDLRRNEEDTVGFRGKCRRTKPTSKGVHGDAADPYEEQEEHDGRYRDRSVPIPQIELIEREQHHGKEGDEKGPQKSSPEISRPVVPEELKSILLNPFMLNEPLKRELKEGNKASDNAERDDQPEESQHEYIGRRYIELRQGATEARPVSRGWHTRGNRTSAPVVVVRVIGVVRLTLHQRRDLRGQVGGSVERTTIDLLYKAAVVVDNGRTRTTDLAAIATDPSELVDRIDHVRDRDQASRPRKVAPPGGQHARPLKRQCSREKDGLKSLEDDEDRKGVRVMRSHVRHADTVRRRGERRDDGDHGEDAQNGAHGCRLGKGGAISHDRLEAGNLGLAGVGEELDPDGAFEVRDFVRDLGNARNLLLSDREHGPGTDGYGGVHGAHATRTIS